MSDDKWLQRLKQESEARRRAEKLLNLKSDELLETQQTLRLALWASNETVWSFNTATDEIKTTRYNQQKQETVNVYTTGEFLSLVHPDDRENVWKAVSAHIQNNSNVIDVACRIYLGSYLQWLRLRGQAVEWSKKDQKALTLIGTARDITEQQLRVKKLDQLAQYDSLTGLLNRRSLQSELEKLTNVSNKVAVMFIDLDGFKLLNDTLGHKVGDEFLVSVAQTLRRVLPKNALIARYGGDEFVIALRYESDTTWRGYAKKLISVKTPFQPVIDLKLDVSGSIGVSLYPKHALDSESLLEFADTAMYEAKSSGKNRFKVYDSSLTDVQYHRTNMLTALRKAVVNKLLHFEIQPVYSSELHIIGGELLCRWHSDELGNVSPAKFIPLAEQYGLAGEITLQALQEAATIFEELDEENQLWLSINICPEQMLDIDFIDKLAFLREKYHIPQKRIKLEITESVFLRDDLEPEECLTRAKKLGFSLAMDDFGTGYSSLAYISRYSFDAVKIDKLFVSQMFLNTKSKKLVEGIAGLCHSLDIDIVAEGCETSEQVTYLQKLNVSALQGFELSRPVTKGAFLELAAK